jgi:hypothetical protein
MNENQKGRTSERRKEDERGEKKVHFRQISNRNHLLIHK